MSLLDIALTTAAIACAALAVWMFPRLKGP